MKLIDYLAATKTSYRVMAARLSERMAKLGSERDSVSEGALRFLAQGRGCHSDLALAIVEETRENPAPGGGKVTLRDLVRGVA